MLLCHALSALLLAVHASAQVTLTGTNSVSTTPSGDSPADATYVSYGSTETLAGTDTGSFSTVSETSTSSAPDNSSESITTGAQATSTSVTYLVGGQGTTSGAVNGTGTRNGTASSTSSSILPTNTKPCNGHPSFCSRKFSNVTFVAAHNSPFDRAGNAASNQALDVTKQLEDGIRMLQFQTHYENETMYLCHSSCDLLNMGTLESYLTTVTQWLSTHPYDVITILMGNDDVVTPTTYTASVQKSGLIDYVYTPPKVPMDIDEWPTLAEMIIKGTRAVVMLDYQANQTAVPWLLDEFGYMFETPFSPTNISFPCNADRPPASWYGALPRQNRMYMANHNLNVDISLAGISLLVPAYTTLNVTNADIDEDGSLERQRLTCTAEWNRPPNFLLVDYYNIGNFNGSVFQVAATANNVSYNTNQCCGTVQSLGFRFQAGTPAVWGSVVAGLLSLAMLI